MEKEKMFQKDFIFVLIGQIISLFGNAILRFALPLYLFDQTQSAAILGIVSASSFVPIILLSPIGGMIADRVNKQRIMVVLDFFTALLVFLFSIIYGSLPLIPTFITILILLFGIQGAYQPAVQASIPLLVSSGKIMTANAIINQVSALASLLGPVLGGMLYGTYGLNPILYVSCFCFVFSAVMELFIKIPFKRQKGQESIWKTVKSDMKISIHFITKEKPQLSRIIIVIALFNLVISSMLIIGLQVILRQTLAVSAELYGASQGALAAGALLGGIIIGVMGEKLSIRKTYILLCICASCCIPMGLTLMLHSPVMVSFAVITGMGFILMIMSSIVSIQIISYVQKETRPELIGKIISCLLAFTTLAQPIGQALYGILFEALADKTWLVLYFSALLAIGITIYSKKIFGKI